MTIYLDTETTGLDPSHDEILQLSIISDSGNILFDSFFRPSATSWDDAQKVNGITPEMVAGSPCFEDVIPQINDIFSNASEIIGYNVNFDLAFLRFSGCSVPSVSCVDVMQDFAIVFGEWSDYHDSYKWQKLTVAADYYHYDWNSLPVVAHNSLADCFATRFVYYHVLVDRFLNCPADFLPSNDPSIDKIRALRELASMWG